MPKYKHNNTKSENLSTTLTTIITPTKVMVTLIITLTVVMKNMITEIRKTNYYNRKKTTTIMATTQPPKWLSNNKKWEKTDFKMEVVSRTKWTEIVKYTRFHVIPYINSPVISHWRYTYNNTAIDQ